MAKTQSNASQSFQTMEQTLWGFGFSLFTPTSIHKLALCDEKQKDIILALRFGQVLTESCFGV